MNFTVQPTIFTEHIRPTLLHSEFAERRNQIELAARVMQLTAVVGLIAAVPSAAISLGSIVTGGFPLFSYVSFVINSASVLAFYDLFQMANNVASIFSASQTSRFCMGMFKGVAGFTSELTQNTMIASSLNPMIKKILEKNPEELFQSAHVPELRF